MADPSAASQPRLMSSLDGATVLLTGGLGFLGSVALERLLRLTAVKKVFLLVRGNKKGSASERVSQLLAGPLFNLLHGQPHAFSRLAVVEGDLRLPGLGLAVSDANALRREVTVVLHAAANMDLELHIQETLKCNYCGTQALLELAAQMPDLASFVHVSTFFVTNHLPPCTRVPERQAAPLPLVLGTTCFASHADFVPAVLALPPDEAHAQVAALMRHCGFASSYALGKHLTEQLVAEAPLGLRARKSIVRPSLISCLVGDPYPGFVTGYAGAPGFVMGYAAGFYNGLSSVPFPSESSLLDIVPCDCVAALVIAAAAAAVAGVGPSAELDTTAIYHANSADSHPLPIAAGFERLAAFWSANPPPFCLPLTRYVTFGDRPHTPSWLGLAVGRWITGAKVGLVCKLLELAGAAGKARLLRNSFKAFCVQNSEDYGRRMSLVCCVDNARQLRKCLQQPDERRAWPLVFDESVASYDDYEAVAFAGARHLLFKVAPGAGSSSKYQPKPTITPTLVQELLQPAPAQAAAVVARPDQAAVGGSGKLLGSSTAGAKAFDVMAAAASVRTASLGRAVGVDV